MQTIGERLEEARKKRAVSLQDAANDTKIRLEYLAALEKNDGREIPLEPIYVRGFIRNYAKFLRTDSAKLIADYDANVSSNNEGSIAKSHQELIGRLELGNDPTPAPTMASSAEQPSVEPVAAANKTIGRMQLPKVALKIPAWAIPVAIGFVGVLVLWGVVAGIGSMMANRAPVAAAKLSDIRLIALGDVTVIAKDVQGTGANTTETTLFAGSMKKGDTQLLSRSGAVRVQYSAGNLIEVEKDGKRYKMGGAGAGRRLIE